MHPLLPTSHQKLAYGCSDVLYFAAFLRKSDSFKHRSANFLFYGPYYILRKFAEENFSIIPHFGVDCTRPVEQTSLVTL